MNLKDLATTQALVTMAMEQYHKDCEGAGFMAEMPSLRDSTVNVKTGRVFFNRTRGHLCSYVLKDDKMVREGDIYGEKQ
jgi:hypothetical protein